MRTLLLSQNVISLSERNEKRDSLDQKWAIFLWEAGFSVLTVPNYLPQARAISESRLFSGILLTGGNDLGEAPERDEVENFLIDKALAQQIPLFGVCRGMQIIQTFFGVPLRRIEGHANTKKKIVWHGAQEEVNSYHHWGTSQSCDELQVTSSTEQDGIIKSIQSVHHRISGIMWHPERETPFLERDKIIFRNFFNEK